MPADPSRARDLFFAAVELPTDRRPGFLAEACRGDAELQVEVVRLLAAHADPDSILEPATPATGVFLPGDPGTTDLPVDALVTQAFDPDAPSPIVMATEAHSPESATGACVQPVPEATTARESESPAPGTRMVPTSEGIGTVIAGRYTLVEVIGEGGMGSVYLASQTEPVKRQVALKLIKTGMDSRGVLARFDAERQALALMDHPNIARIYDGGLTPAGQPFFVMELVKGVPLTKYCDAQRLTVQARLGLFVAVCQAVQHAHQKGIIHRDLKPGNVLVTEVDGRPTPKVIDFGVAKATEMNLTDMSFADTGAIVGTPTYMSPEQADPSSMDIDTRTDVYALGVMLYELLVGSPPLDSRDFRRGAILEMLRMVREVDPPRPSTKLSTAEALPNIAANRSIEPARLSRLLRGELDWVVMKALEKDRNRRYDTANGFARDIQRYLADEVVEARPPSRGYRLKKFVKRNKIQVIAASLVFLTLLGGIVGTSLGMASARRAQKAEARQRGIADDQRDKAIASQRQTGIERDKAIAAERQTSIERDKAIAAEATTRTINDFLIHDLLTQAEPANNAIEDHVTLLEVLDRAAQKVGTRFASQPELEHSLRETIAVTYHGLASWDKAEAQWQAVLDAARKDDPRSAEAYFAQSNLSHILRHRGRLDAEVVQMAETAVKGLERTLGPDHPDTITALHHLAGVYQDVGKLPESIDLFERVRDAESARLGPNNPGTLNTLNNLALVYGRIGRLPEAIALLERVRDAKIAVFGPDHPDTLTTLHNLGTGYRSVGRLPEAIALFERVRDARIAVFGPDHSETLDVLNSLAAAYWSTKQLDKSVPLFEDVLKRQEARLGRQYPDTQRTLGNLGVNYKDAGRLKEAIPLLEEAYQTSKRFPPLRFVNNHLLDAYTKAGENAKLAALIQEQLAAARTTLPKDSPQLAGVLSQIGLSLLHLKKWAEADPLLRECLAIREKTQPDLWSTFNTQSQLGGALLGQKKYAEAEPLLLTGYDGTKQREKLIPPQSMTRLHEALDRLVELYTATDKPDEVKKWQAERAKYPGATPLPGEKK
jgi:serine/threonine protein kinase